MTQVEHAHAYGRHGWAVVPLHHITDGHCTCRKGRKCGSPGKHPKDEAWQLIASSNGADIEAWWEDDPQAGIGIVTGFKSGFWVLDLDGPAGLDTITTLAGEHGPLPHTRMVRTGSGGFHHYFTTPDFAVRNSTSWIGPGVDVRGEAGQVVAPPSVSLRGAYTLLNDCEPLAAPDWLLALVHEHALNCDTGRCNEVKAGEPVDLSFLPTNIRTMISTIIEPNQGRFRAFYATVAACREAGYTQGQTVTIVGPWCLAVDKFANRVAAEVARCWGKLDAADERAEKWLAGSTTTPPAAPQTAPRTPPDPDVPDPPADPPEPPVGPVLTASWASIGLTAILDGTFTPEVPTLFPRTDGAHLLYPGRVHSFHGESESGKSLIAQAEAARILTAGGRALYLDWESDQAAVVERLRGLGASNTQIADGFDYRRPECSPFALAEERDAWVELLANTYALVVLDGVTEALVTSGGATKDNDEIVKWVRAVPRRIAQRTGAAVVLIDHVTKDAENRGRFAIGGQAKMAALDGAAFVIEVAEPLGRGLRGVVAMRIAKDRPGGVRPVCGPFRASDRTQEAARVVIDSTGGVAIRVSAEGPRHKIDDVTDSDIFRPTVLMERVSIFLESQTEPASLRAILTLSGKDSALKAAVGVLVAEGFVTVAEGAKRGLYHASKKPYRADDDELSDTYCGWLEEPSAAVRPSAAPVRPENGKSSAARPPLPVGGGRTQRSEKTPQCGPEKRPHTDPAEIVPCVVCGFSTKAGFAAGNSGRCAPCALRAKQS